MKVEAQSTVKKISLFQRPYIRTFILPYAALALLFSGCLPHGCQRDGFSELAPSDSLSRVIAQQTPLDTLGQAWSTTGEADARLEFPRTVRFGPDRHLFVSDVERNSLFEFTPDGQFVREIADGAFDVPYLAGTQADTLVVLNAGTDEILFVHDGQTVRTLPIAPVQEGRSLLYATATDTALYTKVVDNDDGTSFVARLDRRGEAAARVPLSEPDWRHAGMLRAWGDSLLSLSGFRPVVDVASLPLRDGASVDTMALRGFDSPMLERSYAFLTGDVSTAPLLTAAADPAGDRLFVLNMRPGWVQVDAYDPTGHLQHRLAYPDTTGDAAEEGDFYPRDIAAYPRDDGYDIAVVLTSPAPRLDLYRWRPDTRPTALRPLDP